MSTNPLERIPKRSELPETGVSPYEALHNANVAVGKWMTDKGNQALGVAADVLFGEETGDPWYKDVAYGAVPFGSIYQRAVTGTRPGMVDLLPGEIGSALKLSMLPIAKFGAKEITKGAARMGKSVKNTAKAMEKKNNPTVVRYHRTHAGNVDAIKNEGLKTSNPNYGRNTGDSRDYPPVVWLGNNPTEIPVLRHLLETDPKSVATFKVRIPQKEYYDAVRMRFPNGRGAGIPQVVDRGKPSLTDEGTYKIDMFGEDIPPEYLEEIPTEEITKGIKANENTVSALTTLLATIDDKTSRRLLNENPQLAKRIGRVSDLDNGGWIIGTDKSLGDEIEGLTAPIGMRYLSVKKDYDEALEGVNDKIGRAMKSPYGQELFFHTPNQRMRDALQQFPVDDNGRVIVGEYIPPGTKLSDLVPKEDEYGNMPNPEELGGFRKTAPGPGQVAKGSVSFGGSQDWPTLKERRFNYDKYNKWIAEGHPPAAAADLAMPNYGFQIDPDDATGTRWGWYPKTGHKGPNYGMITEGEGDFYAMNRVKKLMDFARQFGLTPDTRAELHQAFQDVLDRGTIGNFVPSKDKFSEFTPGSRLPDWDLRR